MSNGGEIQPLDPAETLYRRVQEKDFDPAKSSHPEFLAFRPNEHDTDGLSLFRTGMTTAKDVALGRAKAGKLYYVAEIPVSEFHRLGLKVVPDDPAHVSIPEMNASTRRDPETTNLAQGLAMSWFTGNWNSAGRRLAS